MSDCCCAQLEAVREALAMQGKTDSLGVWHLTVCTARRAWRNAEGPIECLPKCVAARAALSDASECPHTCQLETVRKALAVCIEKQRHHTLSVADLEGVLVEGVQRCAAR